MSGIMLEMLASAKPLSVVIGPGASGSGPSSTHTFGPNTAVVTGGIGPFTYAWATFSVGGGTWTSGSGVYFAPAVSNVSIQDGPYTGHYRCTVTDTGAGMAQAVSNGAAYSWTNL